MDLDDVISKFVEERMIPIFGIASAEGFDDALPGWHPRDLMANCESVAVLGHPLVQHPLTVGEHTYM